MATQGAVRKADLVIGIDFGMTCTGVAYANLSRGDIVRTVQKWPGRGMANENKVPTIIVYSRQNHEVTSWGFASETRMEQSNLDRLYVDWFKVYLDETLLQSLQARDAANTPSSMEEVEKWFVDYLSQLYKHIEFKLSQELQGKTWSQALVEFIFSVPTTWAPHPTVERFRSILRRAGYNQHATHSIEVGLTEAEAAAVATCIEAPGIFQANENLLICDVGGGTTDLTVMNIQSIALGSPELKQLDVVIGRNIGSVKIDEAFESLVLDRLRAADQATPMSIDVEDAAWNMMKSKEYQNAKCDHGSPDDTPYFFVPVMGLSPAYANEAFGIQQGSMQFSQNDIRRLFDAQVTRLYDLIDKQLARFQQNSLNQTMSHLILSGGLGNNAYIQSCLKARYEHGTSRYYAACNIQIHVAPDPQLAVAKGIVHNRVRKVNSGKAVLGWRCARASYGTLCKILYDPANPKHQIARKSVDPLDGKTYVGQAIEWFIRKGEAVNSDTPITRPFKRKLQLKDIANRCFPTSILVSHAEDYQLPFTMHEGHSETLCGVISDLSTISEDSFKLKNRHWWNTGKPYRRVIYDIKVVIGPADINFELWFNGSKISRDNPIQVEWQSITAPPPTIDDSTDGTLNVPAISKSRNVGKVARSSVAMLSSISLAQNGVPHEIMTHQRGDRPMSTSRFRS